MGIYKKRRKEVKTEKGGFDNCFTLRACERGFFKEKKNKK